MKFKPKYRSIRLNLAAYRKVLEAHLREAIAFSVFQYLSLVEETIPVYGGASRATFLYLAKAIDYHLPINPRAADTTSEGIQASRGTVDVNPRAGTASFTYQTALEHLIYNEHHDGNARPGPGQWGTLLNPGPYRFRPQALAQFLRFAAAVGLPNPYQSLTSKPIR